MYSQVLQNVGRKVCSAMNTNTMKLALLILSISKCWTAFLISSNVPEMSEKLHDAAWDSYCAGTCFIRMAFIVAVKEFEM